jgi:hypothetical protein
MDDAVRAQWRGPGPSLLRRLRGTALPPVGMLAAWSPQRLIVVSALAFVCWLLLAATGTSAEASSAETEAGTAAEEGSDRPSSAGRPADADRPVEADADRPADGDPDLPADADADRPADGDAGLPADAGAGHPADGLPPADAGPPADSGDPAGAPRHPESTPAPVHGPDAADVDDGLPVPLPPGESPVAEPLTPPVPSPAAAPPSVSAVDVPVPPPAPAPTQALDGATAPTSPAPAAPGGRPQGPSAQPGVASIGGAGTTDALVVPEPEPGGQVSTAAPGTTSSQSSSASAGPSSAGTAGCPAALTGQVTLDPPALRSCFRSAQDPLRVDGGTNDPGARPG